MPPKKKVAAIVKVALKAGAATPAPPVGTALGPHGVNIMEFCKRYNAETEAMRGTIIPVEITIYEDRTFTFITKTPPAAELIKTAAGLKTLVGTAQDVLVEKPGDRGHAGNFADVRVADAPVGSVQRVAIERVADDHLIGMS